MLTVCCSRPTKINKFNGNSSSLSTSTFLFSFLAFHLLIFSSKFFDFIGKNGSSSWRECDKETKKKQRNNVLRHFAHSSYRLQNAQQTMMKAAVQKRPLDEDFAFNRDANALAAQRKTVRRGTRKSFVQCIAKWQAIFIHSSFSSFSRLSAKKKKNEKQFGWTFVGVATFCRSEARTHSRTWCE